MSLSCSFHGLEINKTIKNKQQMNGNLIPSLIYQPVGESINFTEFLPGLHLPIAPHDVLFYDFL